MEMHLCPLCRSEIECDESDLADYDPLYEFDGMPRALVEHVRNHLGEMAVPAKPTLASIAELPADQLVELIWRSTAWPSRRV